MPIEHVAHCTTSNTQKSTSCQPIEESRDEHGLDILRHGAWDKPDQKHRERGDVSNSPAIELVGVSFPDPPETKEYSQSHLRQWTEKKWTDPWVEGQQWFREK